MQTRRRHLAVNPQLETMDSRDVPSALSLRLAAAAHHRAQVNHAAAVHAAKAAAQAARAAAHAMQHRIIVPAQVVVAPVAHPRPTVVASHAQSVSSTVTRTAQAAPMTTAPVNRPLNVIVSTPMTNTNTTATTTTTAATNNDIADVKNGPLAKAGQNLIALYLDFQKAGGGSFTSSQTALIDVVGNQVRVDIRGAGDVNSLVSTLSGAGMQVQSTDATTHTVEGLLPIAQLPAVAQLSQVSSITPVTLARV